MKDIVSKRYPIGKFEYGKTYSINETRKNIKTISRLPVPRELKKCLKRLDRHPSLPNRNRNYFLTLSQSTPTVYFNTISFYNGIATSSHFSTLDDIMRAKQSIYTQIDGVNESIQVNYNLELNFTAQGGADYSKEIYDYILTQVLPDLKDQGGIKDKECMKTTKKMMGSWEEELKRIEKAFGRGKVLEPVKELRKLILLKIPNPNFLKNTLLSIESQYNAAYRQYSSGRIGYADFEKESNRIRQLFLDEALSEVEAMLNIE